jgi:allantoin racemase
MLGKKFSILAYVDEHKYLYEKNLDTYHLWNDCASIRVMNIRPDYDALLGEDAEHEFQIMTRAAEAAVTEDGADVILLGSTTMHEAGEYIAARISAPVINPGPVAIKLTEALVDLGLSHSKVAFPSPRFVQDEKWFALPGLDVDDAGEA